ncbi:hypothetical protein [Methanoregula boonei]|nr:hypothetical protein [Methanoregula boonei]
MPDEIRIYAPFRHTAVTAGSRAGENPGRAAGVCIFEDISFCFAKTARNFADRLACNPRLFGRLWYGNRSHPVRK